MSINSDDAFADEIVEIFVEEVGEVLEQIDEHLPKWKGDNGNQASMKEVRRAFHTLKGSGRMVHADAIGEIAWSVENMLNRIIDGTLNISPMVFELISEVRAAVPTLVSAFENRQAAALAGVNVNDLISKANTIVEGKQVASFESKPAAASNTTTATAPAASVDDAPLAEVDQVEIAALKERIGELSGYIDEVKRNLVSMSTQIDTLSTKVNTQSQPVDVQAINRKFSENAKQVEDLKFFMKSSTQQLMSEAAEVQQKLTARVERQLKDVSDLADQLGADFRAEAEQIRNESSSMVKAWSIGSAVICSLAVLGYILFGG